MSIREHVSEGHGLKKISILDDWDYNTAGGCSNFGMFDKNPAYAINLVTDADVQIRLKVINELAPDGTSLITDPEKFKLCVNVMAFRLPLAKFPVPAKSVDIRNFSTPALSTNEGRYSSNLSSIVSERVSYYYSNNFRKNSHRELI